MQSNAYAVALLVLGFASGCGDDGPSLGDASLELCSADEDCDDGLACSGDERCEAGACRAGKPPTCHDDDPCTRDLCLEPIGCDFVPICEPPIDMMDAGAVIAPDARVPDDDDAAITPHDAGDRLPDASVVVPDAGIEACVGPYYVGDVLATDPHTLERLEGVQCLIGSLDVRGNRITDLDALRALRVVTGNLTITLPELESLSGLDELEHVGLSLGVGPLAGTTEMDVFPSLRVAGNIGLSGFWRVQRLGGFDALEQVGSFRLSGMPRLRWIARSGGGSVVQRLPQAGELVLQALPKLEAVVGFGELRTLGTLMLHTLGAVELSEALEQVRELVALTLIDTQLNAWAMPRLERVTAISISSNAMLTTLDLGSVYAVDSVSLWNNSVLTRMELPGVTTLRSLTVSSNPMLSELRFDRLEGVLDWLSVQSNAELSACAVARLVALTPDPARRNTCCGAGCTLCEACAMDDDGGIDAHL